MLFNPFHFLFKSFLYPILMVLLNFGMLITITIIKDSTDTALRTTPNTKSESSRTFMAPIPPRPIDPIVADILVVNITNSSFINNFHLK